MSFNDIRKFERENNVSVSVFEWRCKRCVTLHLAEKKRRRHVNLLLLQNIAKSHNHYVCIRKSRLVSSQLSKRNHQKHICDRRMNDCALRFQHRKKISAFGLRTTRIKNRRRSLSTLIWNACWRNREDNVVGHASSIIITTHNDCNLCYQFSHVIPVVSI